MIYWKSVIGQACSLMFRIYKINDFLRWPCANYKIYKINDFSPNEKWRCGSYNWFTFVMQNKTHDPQSGTVDITILTEIAKLKNFTFFSRFCHNCSPNVMEIKTHPPSVATGMHSSITEVRRVNFDCKKRNIKSKKPCDFEYRKWPNKRPGRLFNFGGLSGEV